MFQYKFLALCVVAFLALGGSVNAEGNAELQNVDVDIRKIDIEQYDGIIETIMEYLKDFFEEATRNCLKEVAKNCKKIWYNPKKLVKCAKQYFKEHKGECAIPDTLEYETMLMSIYNEDDVENVDLDIRKIDIENYSGVINAIVDYLKDFFQKATGSCLKEVVKNCKKIWYNPKKLIKCAKEYYEEHNGECAVSDSTKYENLIMNVDNDEELVELSEESIIERRNVILEGAIKAIKAVFKYAVKHCVEEAAQHCISHWNNPGALIDCAKKFFKVNQGRCALG